MFTIRVDEFQVALVAATAAERAGKVGRVHVQTRTYNPERAREAGCRSLD